MPGCGSLPEYPRWSPGPSGSGPLGKLPLRVGSSALSRLVIRQSAACGSPRAIVTGDWGTSASKVNRRFASGDAFGTSVLDRRAVRHLHLARQKCRCGLRHIHVLEVKAGDVVSQLEKRMAVLKAGDFRVHHQAVRPDGPRLKFLPEREPSKCVSFMRSISTLPMAFDTHSAAFGSVVFRRFWWRAARA
jgi:hypothetical protein